MSCTGFNPPPHDDPLIVLIHTVCNALAAIAVVMAVACLCWLRKGGV